MSKGGWGPSGNLGPSAQIDWVLSNGVNGGLPEMTKPSLHAAERKEWKSLFRKLRAQAWRDWDPEHKSRPVGKWQQNGAHRASIQQAAYHASLCISMGNVAVQCTAAHCNWKASALDALHQSVPDLLPAVQCSGLKQPWVVCTSIAFLPRHQGRLIYSKKHAQT
eukprot:1153153-Pelagomonas_calceolata.AAC.2